jgi:osmoprotectant transport system substrate-binding protein
VLLPVLVLALVAGACGGDDDDSSSPTEPDTSAIPEGEDIVIGSQDFGESAILAQVYGQALESAGYPVEYQALGGFRELVYTAFDAGEINLTAEYAASALEHLNEQAGEATPEADATVEKLREQLAGRNLVALDPSPAVDSNAFVVTGDTAEEFGLESISDLAQPDVADFELGGPADCPTNPFCIPGLRDRYGIDFGDRFVELDAAGPITVQALRSGEVDVGILFSTNANIAEEEWIVLEDDKGLINAENVVPVLSDQLVEDYGEDFTDLLNQVSAALTTSELTEMNRRYEIDKENEEDIAEEFLRGANLLG